MATFAIAVNRLPNRGFRSVRLRLCGYGRAVDGSILVGWDCCTDREFVFMCDELIKELKDLKRQASGDLAKQRDEWLTDEQVAVVFTDARVNCQD